MGDELKGILAGLPVPSLVDSMPNPGRRNAIGFNVCYVVAGIVIKNGKVLMVQEAKPSCRGSWYLPAGRVEPKESLIEGVQREVKEEAGLDFKPKALIAVEMQGMSWIRFTFVGDDVGGNLKTTAEADKESLQAGWFSSDVSRLRLEVELRAPDVLPLIAKAVKWHQASTAPPIILPTPKCHSFSTIRVVLLQEDGPSYKVMLASSTDGPAVLPVTSRGNVIPFNNLLYDVLKKNGLSETSVTAVEVVGVLSVEHDYQPQCHETSGCDGVCITLLLKGQGLDGGVWQPVQDEAIQERLRNCVTTDHGLIWLK